MNKTCSNCSKTFEVLSIDEDFYKKISVPAPSTCPSCRQQLRASFRNERNLHRRKCDKTGESIISMYRPDSPATVYSSKSWWSDDWDPLEYGQPYDFTRPFFEQYAELQRRVPRLALYQKNCENADFSNHVDSTKNAYLCVDIVGSEDTYYSKWIIHCNDLCDSYHLEDSEQCYEGLYTVGAHDSRFIYLADNSYNSDFLYNTKNVKHSLMCYNLRNKEYHIKNHPYTKEEYETHTKNYDPGSYKNLQAYIKEYEKIRTQALRRPAEIIHCENCTGDYLYNCKNVQNSYGVIESQDCNYCYDSAHLKDCHDTYEAGFDCELQYNSHACNRGKSLISCSISYDVDNCSYCEMCHNSSDLFGCIALRHKKYCILNKQYTKEEYFSLLPKIIDHMLQTGEYGNFFPKNLSFFSYNESAAPEFISLTKSQATSQGWHWQDLESNPQTQTYEIPDHIRDVPDSITKETLSCQTCHQNYRIISQELTFYRAQNLPIPRHCPNCRYFNRLKHRNPYQLYDRTCASCQAPIKTTYSPDRPETVYCESCYLKEIY